MTMTREEAVAKLVELDVAKWGESERESSARTNGKMSHGLALNRLAHYDINNVDASLAAQAEEVMTSADARVLRDAT